MGWLLIGLDKQGKPTPSAERRCWCWLWTTANLGVPFTDSPPSTPSCIFPYTDRTDYSIQDARKHGCPVRTIIPIWYLATSAREHCTTIELFNSSLREKKPWRDRIAVEHRVRRYTQTEHLRDGQRREVKARSRKSGIWDAARSTRPL
jgi:hypothetical protein